MAALKKFNARLEQTLNGVDTYRFDLACTSSTTADRFKEGATLLLKVNGELAFGGEVRYREKSRGGFVQSIIVESPLQKIRDTSAGEEEDPRNLTTIRSLLENMLPEGFTISYNAAYNPAIKYAFRSGSISTHLNTLCSMAGLNWRNELLTATTSNIVISEGGEARAFELEMVENVDIFNLKVDASLFKQYTRVTAIGVEKEVAGYTCTASIPATIPYALLDYDDGELYDEEILPEGSALYAYSAAGFWKTIHLQNAGLVKGWGGDNDVFLINSEFIRFGAKIGADLTPVERGYWNSPAIKTHAKDDGMLLVKSLYLKMPQTATGYTPTSASLSPPTNLFVIGNEIIRTETTLDCFTAGELKLATVNATTSLYEGRGQMWDSYFEEWAFVPETAYPHRQGMVIYPYYGGMTSDATQSLDVTIHGKGIVDKDGIDRLAWGTLKNIQNGIISGSCTYKCGDFYDPSVAVGQKVRITTASTKTSSSSIISPATSYDVLIYSIKREQNKLMTIEFGNVVPEILNMLKSGEYALQAAIRKQGTTDAEDVDSLSLSGKIATTTKGRAVKIHW